MLTRRMFCCAGTIVTFSVQNNYNTYRFGGHKVMLLLPDNPCMTFSTPQPHPRETLSRVVCLKACLVSVSLLDKCPTQLPRQRRGV